MLSIEADNINAKLSKTIKDLQKIDSSIANAKTKLDETALMIKISNLCNTVRDTQNQNKSKIEKEHQTQTSSLQTTINSLQNTIKTHTNTLHTYITTHLPLLPLQPLPTLLSQIHSLLLTSHQTTLTTLLTTHNQTQTHTTTSICTSLKSTTSSLTQTVTNIMTNNTRVRRGIEEVVEKVKRMEEEVVKDAKEKGGRYGDDVKREQGRVDEVKKDYENLLRVVKEEEGVVNEIVSIQYQLHSSIANLNTKINQFNLQKSPTYYDQSAQFKSMLTNLKWGPNMSDAVKDELGHIMSHNEEQKQVIQEVDEWYAKMVETMEGKNMKQLEYRGCNIVVRKGRLVEEREDAVVCQTDERLENAEGPTKEIREVGGETVEKELKGYIEKFERLNMGEAMVTGSGNLPCNHVIHVVGPIYKKGLVKDQEERKMLRKALKSMLEEFNKKNLKSISFPAISTGIFNFPLQKCGTMIGNVLKEAIDADPKQYKNKRLIICNFDDTTTNAMIEHVLPAFDATEVEPDDENNQENSNNSEDDQEEEKDEVKRRRSDKDDEQVETSKRKIRYCIKCSNEVEDFMRDGKYRAFKYSCYACYGKIYKKNSEKYQKVLAKKKRSSKRNSMFTKRTFK